MALVDGRMGMAKLGFPAPNGRDMGQLTKDEGPLWGSGSRLDQKDAPVLARSPISDVRFIGEDVDCHGSILKNQASPFS
jgi:hypothetical protein